MSGPRVGRRTVVIAVAVVVVLVLAALVVRLAGRGTDAPAPGASASPTPSESIAGGEPFPDEGSTGVPDGVTLTPSGALEVTTDGAVVEGLDIDGCVDVLADHVTIRSSRITCSRPTTAIRLQDGRTDLVVEDVEIDGTGVVSAAVGFSDYTLLRVDIHDVVDGPRLGSNTRIQDSYVHNLSRTEGSHNDAVQIAGGEHIRVLHNTLDAFDARSGDLFNAAVMVGAGKTTIDDVLIAGNYLNGGNYTVNFRPDVTARAVVGRDNTFGPDHRYGELAGADLPGVQWTGEPSPSPGQG